LKKTHLFLILFLSVAIAYSQNPDTNLLFVEGGKFFMGNATGENNEKPLHKVTLDYFYIGKTEVTNLEFVEFLNSEGNQIEHNTPWILLSGEWKTQKCGIFLEDSVYKVEVGFENFPVVFVSWYGADAYCKWKGGRLPTEAEWEYLAKCRIKSRENFEIGIDTLANYSKNSDYKIKPVASMSADCNGIYDLFGNLSEWTNDWYGEDYYDISESKNPSGPETGTVKVIRGGSWYNKEETINQFERRAVPPNSNNITIGFRIAY